MPKNRSTEKLKSLFRILAARAHLRCVIGQNGPAAFRAIYHRLTQHPSNQRAATPAAAGTGPDPGAFAHLFECLCAGLDRFDHSAFADLVAKAGRFEILDDRPLSSFPFQFVDGEYLPCCEFSVSVAQS